MADPREATVGNPTGHRTGHRVVFALTFLFVLAAVVVYTAWHQDLKDGLFALAFAVLTAGCVKVDPRGNYRA